MKATKYMLAGLMIAGFGGSSASAAELRTWTDVEGRQVPASFVQIEGDTIVLQTADGAQHRFPLARLSADDLAIAKAAQAATPAAPLLPANATPAQAARVIDQLVYNGFKKANEARAEAKKAPLAGFNPIASDEQFVRRVYLDIAGRIPNYEEVSSFLKDGNAQKRTTLIDMLLESDGYKTHLYNYFAEMLRIKDNFEQDNVRGTPYINWFKDQIAKNEKWDKIVYQLTTATGKMWDRKEDGSYNGAAGYLLRDAGMPLDNLANTLTVFLGTDVACAQCHDHPFADWTQKQFYEMASYFGATTTRLNGRDMKNGDPMARLMADIEPMVEKSGQDLRRIRNGIQNFIRANQSAVKDRYQVVRNGETEKTVPANGMKLPHDYQYKDGNPGDPVAPKFVTWSSQDKENPAYKQDQVAEENLRQAFANWMTHPENPRFAMTIANRMWKRAFGAGVNEPITNIDDPDQSANPELLRHLAAEMKRVNFDLKQFMRIVYNTRAYQSESTTENINLGEVYYFQGPMLRRMSAEQAWDSYMTLVLGQPDAYKAPLQDLYAKSIDMNLDTVDAQTVLVKYSAYRSMQTKERALMGGGLDMVGGDGMMMEGGAAKKGAPVVAATDGPGKILDYEGMRLMRASEITQPAPGGHFLIDFGQSPRNLIDGSTKIGNVPQVLMMMNGKAQKMLTSRDSLVFRTMDKVNNPADKVERMFMTIMNRRPTLQEKDIAKRELSSHGEEGYSNMIWALINTREFMFIQ
ncbi:SLA1 Homology Domain 1 (SHD1) protein [Prosthecobacter fusiformis]|uniref:SLA1 Homology Domain 1 (SHD1) protein n=1 Tax=Prosthecobacter fusiformis TaxID=48464 RepID=A0A4R7RSX2_9BACT|nr:DUF1549 domain-containing protein [Prosthecobacter fusiformis]TDU68058.1 SLA1 Homology Domain 1 (SHD1) protein [Prosthecobacter fusiformis]